MFKSAQKHFLWIIEGPDSSYSYLFIHIVWNVDNDANIDPPSQTEYFLSGGAKIFILLVDGANECISYHILSAIPSNRVDPPLKIMF